MENIFYLIILIFSIVLHEMMHGFAAEYWGDDTARLQGRLTLNPIAHIDLFGSIILPVLLVLTGSRFLFGWAKPVPFNPLNLRDKKWGTISVAIAGVLANFSIALFFGLIIRLSYHLSYTFPPAFYSITSLIVIVNIGLGIFNLVPLPPLDGSKILLSFLPRSAVNLEMFLENYGFILLVIFIFFYSEHLVPIMLYIFKLFTGLAI